MKRDYLYILVFLSIWFSLSSCEDGKPVKPDYYNCITNCVYGYLPDDMGTRADYIPNDDNWRISSFREGDVAGLYSGHGNNETPEAMGGFENVPMEYNPANSSVSQFYNPNIQINTYTLCNNSAGPIMMYLPYSESMANPGLELRSHQTGTEGRCFDFIHSIGITYDRGRANINFIHQFSELIIIRGEGFDEAVNKDIVVVLKNGYSHVRYTYNTNNWQGYPELWYSPGYELDQDQCRAWKAWLGDRYMDSEAQYVMLPTNAGSGNSNGENSIDYIEIYDNKGDKQKVTSFVLGNKSNKNLTSGHIYPIQIVMDDLEPTVFPYPIIKWNQDNDLSVSREKGIHNAHDYNEWVKYYNTYRDEGSEEYLSNYGDKIDGIWHFYILDSIDFSNEPPSRVNKLNDIIDGKSTQLENGVFKNSVLSNISLSKHALFTLIEENGGIINLDIEDITVTDCVAAVAKEINGATFTNFNVDSATLSSSGNDNVGILGGDVSSVNINGCYFSGFVLGTATSESYPGLLGSVSGTVEITNSDYSDIIVAYK